MRVLRRRHTLGFTALLVFAMQLAVVFANTHVHSVARSEALASRAITHGMCKVGAERPCPAPVQHDDGKCQICSAIGLAGAALVSVPPPFPARQPEAARLVPLRMAALVQGADGIHFQARAPPLRAQQA